ncbi:hypothetical protein ILYODFUR_017202 [Ilyodon furcidens]|uniref:Uncharacterized protein n=1 Tax=Ilyodon furcidens TaxID=33524 RepID=A0ABV0V632_9TELE
MPGSNSVLLFISSIAKIIVREKRSSRASKLQRSSQLEFAKATLTDIIRHFGENGARPHLRKKSQRPQDPHFISREQLHRVLPSTKKHNTEEHTEEGDGDTVTLTFW